MRTLLLAAATVAILTGCGSPTSSAADPSSSATSTAPTLDRAACAAQLRTGSRIADRERLTRLPLEQFQLRSNDLQEVVEEADHVCPPQVVAPLKASMLRMLATDDYLLACAPSRTCEPTRLHRLLGDVQRLERQAVARFRG